MLGFVKNLIGAKACPIGVDFGSDSLKLAQAVRSVHVHSVVRVAPRFGQGAIGVAFHGARSFCPLGGSNTFGQSD